jgi:hypothetical protein
MDTPRIVKKLFQMAHPMKKPNLPKEGGDFCAYFEEYTHLLRAIRSQKRMEYVDLHNQPQVLASSVGRVLWVGGVSELAYALNGLTGYGLHEIKVDHLHATPRSNWQPTPTALKNICVHSMPEFSALNINPSTGVCGKMHS